MNTFSPYHSTSTDVLLKRFRLWKRQYLHVVIYTSLFWIFVDVFFIMLFSDCTKEIIIPCSSASSPSKTFVKYNDTQIDEPSLPRVPRNPKILLGRFTNRTETSTTKIPKWWDVKPGATNPPNWHGEGGRGVVIPQDLQEQSKKRFTENQFNILASDLMALNRSIKDQRSPRFYFCNS